MKQTNARRHVSSPEIYIKNYAPFKCQAFKKAEKEPLSAKICSSLKYFLSEKPSVSRNWSFKFILSFSSIYTPALRKMRQRKYPKLICSTCILFCSTFTLTFAENILPIKNCTNKSSWKYFLLLKENKLTLIRGK